MRVEEFLAKLHEFDRAAWSLAAIAAALRDNDETAFGVLQALGLTPPDDRGGRLQVASGAAAPLLQAAQYIAGVDNWSGQNDEALLAQGRASATAGTIMPEVLFPQLSGWQDAANTPLRMLDVGVGVAAMAVALCQALPQLAVVGLDVLDRPLELARRHVAESGLTDRIELRKLDVAELDEEDAFDLVWLPAPFIPPPSLEAGVRRALRALRPGRWVIVGHGRFDGDPLDDAVTRFKTAAYGGTPLDDVEAARLLEDAGFTSVMRLQTPPGAPAITAGVRPDAPI